MAVYTTIDNPELYFQVKKYTGNSGTQSITLDGDIDMEPDIVWLKAASDGGEHAIYDSVRGATKSFEVSDALAEETVSDGLTAFASDGFSLGAGGDENSATTIIAWCWKESTTAGLDIVSFTGSGSARTVSHSLSAVPHLMWVKNRADETQHNIYHHKNTSNPETEILYVNLPNGTSDDNGFWNDTAPTSSVFTVGGDNGTNGSSDNMISYLWTEKQGFSKFGSYTGNGNADGAFIYTGFRPAWVMIKGTAADLSWTIYDNKRGYNPDNAYLLGDANDAEASDKDIDILSNGFKPRTSNSAVGTDGNTYLYMAFAEAPFVNSNGVPCNAR